MVSMESADHEVRVRADLIGGVGQCDDFLLEGGELGLERVGRAVIMRTRKLPPNFPCGFEI